ncbi:hypothetical protein IFM89_024372 [Coptis chinensis]|uniref:Uncharacterized protein n=1 Tax=Coptis chinensis TaxID=261450 RepID=A0A835MFV8_9MAGN|nr:hypothetical protein IFM89_024372 [Coptis chinensis]
MHLGVVGLGGLGHVAVKFVKAFRMKVTDDQRLHLSKKQEAIEHLGDDFLVNCGSPTPNVEAQDRVLELGRDRFYVVDCAQVMESSKEDLERSYFFPAYMLNIKRLLVQPYMSNGSIASRIKGELDFLTFSKYFVIVHGWVRILKPGQSVTATQLKEMNMIEDENAPKARKPYTISKQQERWTEEKHKKFLEALASNRRDYDITQCEQYPSISEETVTVGVIETAVDNTASRGAAKGAKEQFTAENLALEGVSEKSTLNGVEELDYTEGVEVLTAVAKTTTGYAQVGNRAEKLVVDVVICPIAPGKMADAPRSETEANKTLKDIQKQQEQEPFESQRHLDEMETEKIISNLMHQEATMWKQRACIKEELEGDRNSAYFQAKARIRQSKYFIAEIKTAEGTILHDQDLIKEYMVQAYKTNFAAIPVLWNQELLNLIPQERAMDFGSSKYASSHLEDAKFSEIQRLQLQCRTYKEPGDIWSTSTCGMNTSAIQSQRSVSSMSTSNQTLEAHYGLGSTNSPPEFVNYDHKRFLNQRYISSDTYKDWHCYAFGLHVTYLTFQASRFYSQVVSD